MSKLKFEQQLRRDDDDDGVEFVCGIQLTLAQIHMGFHISLSILHSDVPVPVVVIVVVVRSL